MPYSSPSTQATGQVGTGAYANSLKAATDYLANPPACRVYNNTNQAVATGTLVTLAFNSERFDTNGMHDNTTNNSRITAVTAGLYVVTAYMSFTASAAGSYRQTTIRLNGAGSIARVTTSPQGQPANHVVTALWKAGAGDYFTVEVDHDAGAGINAVSNASWSPEFSAVWVGLG